MKEITKSTSIADSFTKGADMFFCFFKEITSYETEKIYLHTPPCAAHAYGFLILISLTHPGNFISVVLQITHPQH
jgi:hypothetical protein